MYGARHFRKEVPSMSISARYTREPYYLASTLPM